jgi:polysaccharide pyruvyl transferase WcaK-like protein
VLVIANIGHGNVGDEAVFAGLVPHLTGAADVTAVARDPVRVHSVHGVQSVPLLSFEVCRSLLGTDVIAVGGGGMFGAGLPPLVRVLPFALCFARLVLRKRLLFQAVGAYQTTPQPTLAALRLAGRLSETVLVRDEASVAVFRGGRAGRGVQPVLVGDPAIFLAPAGAEDAWDVLGSGGATSSLPPLVLSLKSSPDQLLTITVIDVLGAVAQWWCDRRSSDVVVLPLSDIGDYGLGPSWSDAVLGQRLSQRLRDPRRVKILPCDLHPALAKAVIGEAAAVIAMRLHASIFAWSMGVPLLTLPFEPKTDSWVRQIEGDAVPLSQVSPEAIVAWLDHTSGANQVYQ